MNVLFNLIVVLQVVSALSIIGLVLVQHGKGADMGAAFGSGASGSLFGASGSSNFLSKSTAVAAGIFFATTLGLAYFGNARPHAAAPSTGGVMEGVVVPAKPLQKPSAGDAVPSTTPAAPVAPAAPATPVVQDVPGVATPAAPAK
jgi:preprotein translocase subunit SecG